VSDDLDIRHGGAIVVDTEALRDVGHRLALLAAELDDANAAVARALAAISNAGGYGGEVDLLALAAGGERIGGVRARMRDASTATLLMADAYEVVELRAEAAALRLVDGAAADAVQTRLDRLLASDARLDAMSDRLIADWKGGRFDGLGSQFDPGGLLSPFVMGSASAAVLTGLGTLRPGATLQGTADAVAVTAVRTGTPGGPPTSLAGAFTRLPTAPGAQLRVERYTLPDGTRQFIAYVKGSQSVGFGGSQPWDMRSNLQLYTGQTSASYQATLDALEAAGAEPGDRVDVVAHSQGGIIAAHLAMESGYDVQVQLTAGSPVEPTLDDDQLLIQLRHTDDVVSSLAGGGSPAGTGSPESFTAERVGDPISGLQDLVLAPHQMDAYLETAEMVDDSGDVRLDALDRRWADLEGAVEITSIEFRAERTD
jgi:pimeloyl-ACP methyl ester carboxylesterase